MATCYTEALFGNEGLTSPLLGVLPADKPQMSSLRDDSCREPPKPSWGSLYLMPDPQRHKEIQDPPPRPANLGGPSQLQSFPQGGWRPLLRPQCSPALLLLVPFLPNPFANCCPKHHCHSANSLYDHHCPQSLLSREPTCNTLLLGLLFFLVKYIFSKQSMNDNLLGFPFLGGKNLVFYLF